ncbi:hypothetical protein AAFC00_004601 [Neodothiora populina]|uniref:Signal recognition particle receptor subunit beta n=1 Tax=Neodothiora populina TaxID=2781224 RepID=A0ABR3P2U7_9PEZI
MDRLPIDKDTIRDWLTWSFSPSISAIVITFLISILLPISIHLFMYRAKAVTVVPSFLLVGPSGAGKTTLLTRSEHGTAASTHTSQSPQAVTCRLPSSVTARSSQYRAADDPSKEKGRQFELIDTPGHGKLRHHAFTALESEKRLRGLIFVLDSAAVASPAGLTEAAMYLHDVLLALQKRHTASKTSKGPASIPVLIAANKLDIFTGLPAQVIKKKLQQEITNIRTTRAKGLLDSATGSEGEDEEREWLGEGGEGVFKFKQLEESEIEVTVLGSIAIGDQAQTDEMLQWVAQQM